MNAPARFLRSIAWSRWCSMFFSAFALTVIYVGYETYCVLPRVYFGESVIELLPQASAEPDEASPATVVEVLQTPDILLPIITDLKLDQIWAKRVFKSQLDALPSEDALKFMKQHLKLTPITATHIVHIRFASEVPKEAADVANAMADRFKTVRELEVDRRILRERGTLRSQIEVQQAVLAEKVAVGDAQPIAVQKAVLDELNVRLKQLRDGSETEESPVRIIARAEPPEEPARPNYRSEMTFSIPEGICIGMWAATLIELLIWSLPLIAATPWNDALPRNASEEY